MEHSRPYRPRVSRETRLLLATALLALVALWVLARIRFPERPATPNPVQPLLTQLAARPTFDDLVSGMAEVQPRIESSLVALSPASLGISIASGGPVQPLIGLRVRDDLVVALLSPDADSTPSQNAVAYDSASGLTAIRTSVDGPVSPPAPWFPRRLQQPRYLMASDALSQRVSLRPVFVGALDPVESPGWSEPIWLVPAHTDLMPGTFVFSSSGELAGVVISHGSHRAIVPAEVLLTEVDRLLGRQHQRAGDLGIRVQSLTPSLASASGATAGVVVAWVDEKGAAAGTLMVADVIEEVNARPMATPQHWDAHLARLAAGETLSLRVRRNGAVAEVQIVAPAMPEAPASVSLGLTLRRLPGVGAEIIRVDPSSAAGRAGLLAGDVIRFIGGVDAPTPAQVRSVFASARDGQLLLLGRTRGETHDVITLAK